MYRRILVPIDCGPLANRALDAAIDIARLSSATIRVLHVLDDLVFATGFEMGATYAHDVLPRLKRDAERCLAKAQGRVAAAGIAVDSVLVECFARRTSDLILEAAKEWPADLIALGTHGRRGVTRLLLGSDAEQVLRAASVPVLLVRSCATDDDEPVRRETAETATIRPSATAEV
jgi:nucleotide-binding universal stress UspA family protein